VISYGERETEETETPRVFDKQTETEKKEMKRIRKPLEVLGADLGLLWILAFDLDETADWLKQHAGER
jgi:hypothetical protein